MVGVGGHGRESCILGGMHDMCKAKGCAWWGHAWQGHAMRRDIH